MNRGLINIMIISNYVSKRIVNILSTQNIIESEETIFYEYCFDFTLDILLFSTNIFLFGAFIEMPIQSLVIIFTLMPTKMLAGGAHANSIHICSLISYFVVFIIFYLTKLPSAIPLEYNIIFNIIISIAIMIMAPVDHPNKRFSPEKKKKIKLMCAAYIMVINAIYVLVLYFNYYMYLKPMTLCLITIAINQIIGIITDKERKIPQK